MIFQALNELLYPKLPLDTVFVGNVVPISIVTFYIIFIKIIGPKFMESRKPFRLQNTIIIYNSLLAICNMYLTYNIFAMIIKTWGIRCRVKHTMDTYKEGLVEEVCPYVWQYYLSKYVDLLDTVFFVLRKKNSQISFLHVFHHSFMCLLFWYGFKIFLLSYFVVVSAGLNSAVHVVMYSYYALSACGPSVRKHLWWKKHLTLVQMAQFVVLLFYLGYGFVTGCEDAEFMETACFVFLFLLLLLFLNFYIKSYKKDK